MSAMGSPRPDKRIVRVAWLPRSVRLKLSPCIGTARHDRNSSRYERKKAWPGPNVRMRYGRVCRRHVKTGSGPLSVTARGPRVSFRGGKRRTGDDLVGVLRAAVTGEFYSHT